MENRVLAVVRRTVERALGASVSVTELPDRRVGLSHGSGRAMLVPVWAGEGYPRDVRNVLTGLDHHPLRDGETLVVVARRMSPGARRELDTRRVSWLDAAGSCRVEAEGLLIVVDAPTAGLRPTLEGVRWAEAPGAVAEHLLGLAAQDLALRSASRSLPTVHEIRDALGRGVSATLVSRALRMFDAEGWTSKVGPERGPGSTRRLVEAGSLLSSWAAWQSSGPRPRIDAHALIRNSDLFLDRDLPSAWGDMWWALTGPAALERRAPFFTNVPVLDVYVDGSVFSDDSAMDGVLARVELRRVDSGGRLRIHPADRYLPTLVGPSPQVGDVRLYADLLRLGGRAEEAAEHLRETRIGF